MQIYYFFVLREDRGFLKEGKIFSCSSLFQEKKEVSLTKEKYSHAPPETIFAT